MKDTIYLKLYGPATTYLNDSLRNHTAQAIIPCLVRSSHPLIYCVLANRTARTATYEIGAAHIEDMLRVRGRLRSKHTSPVRFSSDNCVFTRRRLGATKPETRSRRWTARVDRQAIKQAQRAVVPLGARLIYSMSRCRCAMCFVLSKPAAKTGATFSLR